MTAVGDALTALKSVVLMQERLDGLRREIGEIRAQVGRLDDRVIDINGRVIRIEALIEFSGRGPAQPRIEG